MKAIVQLKRNQRTSKNLCATGAQLLAAAGRVLLAAMVLRHELLLLGHRHSLRCSLNLGTLGVHSGLHALLSEIRRMSLLLLLLLLRLRLLRLLLLCHRLLCLLLCLLMRMREVKVGWSHRSWCRHRVRKLSLCGEVGVVQSLRSGNPLMGIELQKTFKEVYGLRCSLR